MLAVLRFAAAAAHPMRQAAWGHCRDVCSGADPVRPRSLVAHEAAKGAADLPEVHPVTSFAHADDNNPDPAESPTAHLLQELQLYGHRPFEDELDPRPLPEDHLVRAAIADTFDAFACAFQDTRLEPDLENLLWGITNVLHRATDRVERQLDDNVQAQMRRRKKSSSFRGRQESIDRVCRWTK